MLAEQLFGKVPVIIIDQEGEFATLREKYDYILVGKGGETPTTTQSAGLLSHRLLELRASAIVDLYDLEISTRKLWIKKFFEGIMSAPKKFWRPTVFIIDEAHDFIPEKMESECAHILASAISKGRKRGFAFVCATQRLSKLNKDVASELQNVLIGKTWLDIDRERGASALGIYSKQDKEAFYDKVKRLEQGEFYAQGAALTLDRTLFRTGTVQTSHPDSSNVKNNKKWLVPPPTPKAVAALLGKLGDLPKEAAEEAQTVSELKSKVYVLQHELKNAMSSAKRPVLPASSAPDPSLSKKLATIQRALDEYKTFAHSLHSMLTGKNEQMAQAASILSSGAKTRIPSAPVQKKVINAIPKVLQGTSVPRYAPSIPKSIPVRAKVLPAEVSEVGSQSINNKQRDILRALAEFAAIGRNVVPRPWVAARAGCSHRSSAYANNVSGLRTGGFIEYYSDGIGLTEAGREATPQIDSPMNTEDMLQSCQRLLSGKQINILNYLHGIYPESDTREGVAENSEASVLSSAFANNVSSLKSAGMIEYLPNRELKASSWLFID